MCPNVKKRNKPTELSITPTPFLRRNEKMTIQNLTRLLAVVLTMATMLSFAACGPSGGNDGSLKLESFIIDPTSIKTEYVIGEKVDFSGIKATAK